MNSFHMVTTKRIMKMKKSSGAHWKHKNWDLGSVIVALLGTILIMVTFLSHPHIEVLHHQIIFTQGIVASALIMGATFWLLIELFTPPGTTIIDLLARIVPAFVIGGLLGGFLGYEYHFGSYVLQPALSGNPNALLFLFSSMVAALAIIWNAAWSHSHGFRGQGGKHSRKMHMKESGTSKGKRSIIALFVIVFVILLIGPTASGMGGLFVHGHDSTHVLQAQSSTEYITGSAGAIPFGSVNGTATFDFPANTTTVYVQSNMTLAELNDFSASKIILSSSVKNFTVLMGTGTNSSDFTPIASSSSGNSSSASFPIQEYEILGNQSSPITFEITANVTSMSLHMATYGNSGLVTDFGPYQVLQTGYIIGAIMLFAAAFFSLSMYDISLKPMKASAIRGGRK